MTAITFEHIRGLLFDKPLCIHPDKLAVAVTALAGRTGIAFDPDLVRAANERIDGLPVGGQRAMRGPAKSKPSSTAVPYRIVEGTAIIPIHGSLTNRGAWIGSYSGLTSMEGLRHQVRSAIADEDVTSVLFDIDSPGGQASGTFETAALIRELSGKKQTIAVIDDTAASAGYALASATSKILITPSGVAGSIGVVLMHLDQSRRLDEAGITPSFVYAGKKKIDGNQFQPLRENVRKDLQAEVDAIYEMFVECVAKGRPNLSPAAIEATEAAVYIGRAAIEAGLADQIGDLETALAELSSRAPTAPNKSGLSGMKPAATASAPAPVANATDPTELAAILALPQAIGREDYARIMASQGVSVETARKALESLPTKSERVARDAAERKQAAAIADQTRREANTAAWDNVTSDINRRMLGPKGVAR